MSNINEVTPKIAEQMLKLCINAGVTPFIQSMPGLGKSSIVKKIAEEAKLKVIDVRLSTCDVTDLTGLPKLTDKEAKFVPFNFFPVEGTPIPEGYNGWLLFLDEFNSAPRSVLAAAYKLVLDRQVGTYNLHPQLYIVCAGNRAEDNAITNEIGTALISRVVHINMKPSKQDWLEAVGYAGYDYRILAFLEFNSQFFIDFKPENESEEAYPCPRSWEFVNKLLKASSSLSEPVRASILGSIGSEAGATFLSFCDVFDEIPKVQDIIKDPENTPLPERQDLVYAVTCALMSAVTKDNFSKCLTYLQRIGQQSIINLFLSAVCKQKPQLMRVPAFVSAVSSLGKAIRVLETENDY